MIHAKQKIYTSNGNLIITGEYFVLAGAKALAFPLKFGQQMKVGNISSSNNVIQWEAYEFGKLWFKVDFNSENLNILRSNNLNIALGLQKILKESLVMNPQLFSKNTMYRFICDMNFSLKWGWGSSATLISNIASWANINPFELNKRVSNGSGYDIVTSNSSTPIFYQINANGYEISPVLFNPEFKSSLYFVYLGRKQNTSGSIQKNLKSIMKSRMVPQITWLTEQIAKEEDLNEFVRYVIEHENIISKTIDTPRIKEEYFKDFDGEIKSLGAWGGDFAMAISLLPDARLRQYFSNKGLNTLFRFDEIVKS